MINIDGNHAQIKGNHDELLNDLVVLNVTIMQDTGLIDINTEAINLAIKAIQERGYTIPEVRKFKVAGADKTDEFRRNQKRG